MEFVAKGDATGKQVFRWKKRQFLSNDVDVYLEKKFSISAKFTDVSCNCKQQLSQNKW
jgi:hypothetical protein